MPQHSKNEVFCSDHVDTIEVSTISGKAQLFELKLSDTTATKLKEHQLVTKWYFGTKSKSFTPIFPEDSKKKTDNTKGDILTNTVNKPQNHGTPSRKQTKHDPSASESENAEPMLSSRKTSSPRLVTPLSPLSTACRDATYYSSLPNNSPMPRLSPKWQTSLGNVTPASTKKATGRTGSEQSGMSSSDERTPEIKTVPTSGKKAGSCRRQLHLNTTEATDLIFEEDSDMEVSSDDEDVDEDTPKSATDGKLDPSTPMLFSTQDPLCMASDVSQSSLTVSPSPAQLWKTNLSSRKRTRSTVEEISSEDPLVHMPVSTNKQRPARNEVKMPKTKRVRFTSPQPTSDVEATHDEARSEDRETNDYEVAVTPRLSRSTADSSRKIANRMSTPRHRLTRSIVLVDSSDSEIDEDPISAQPLPKATKTAANCKSTPARGTVRSTPPQPPPKATNTAANCKSTPARGTVRSTPQRGCQRRQVESRDSKLEAPKAPIATPLRRLTRSSARDDAQLQSKTSDTDSICSGYSEELATRGGQQSEKVVKMRSPTERLQLSLAHDHDDIYQQKSSSDESHTLTRTTRSTKQSQTPSVRKKKKSGNTYNPVDDSMDDSDFEPEPPRVQRTPSRQKASRTPVQKTPRKQSNGHQTPKRKELTPCLPQRKKGVTRKFDPFDIARERWVCNEVTLSHVNRLMYPRSQV